MAPPPLQAIDAGEKRRRPRQVSNLLPPTIFVADSVECICFFFIGGSKVALKSALKSNEIALPLPTKTESHP